MLFIILCAELSVSGTSVDSVDLLKTTASDADNGVFAFDGKSVAYDVTDDMPSGMTSTFTVATWIKHEQGDDEELKQHVLCSADAEGACECRLYGITRTVVCVDPQNTCC